MRNLIFIVFVIITIAACRKVTCSDAPIYVNVSVTAPDTILVYKISSYAKGSGFTSLLSIKTDTTRGHNELPIQDAFDWMIEIPSAGMTYTITNIYHKKRKGGNDINFGSAHSKQCSTDLYYTLNGKETLSSGKEWMSGLYSPDRVIINISATNKR